MIFSCRLQKMARWVIAASITASYTYKARIEESRTTIYQRASDVNYQLKMKTSRAVFSEVQKKAGPFPFTLRCLEDEKRARMGVQEAVQHGLLRPYEVLCVATLPLILRLIERSYTPANSFVAAFHFTIALLAGGPSLISHKPVWYDSEKLKTEKELDDEELKQLLSKPLRESKKSKKKTKAANDGEGEDAEEEKKE